MPVLESEFAVPDTATNDVAEAQLKHTTARAIELVTEALRVSAGLSRLTSKAQELERDLKEALRNNEHAETDPVAEKS